MRLPLRHRPPPGPWPHARCAHLEALVEALIGVPLGPAAAAVASARSRGRHGNALQWHLGLSAHDGAATLDWEDRIEVKLVTVWRRGEDDVACDKLKVCDINVDPWRKLSNVLFVHADRLTRVVVHAALFHLGEAPLQRLAAAWSEDPHFGDPPLFVEAREHEGRRAPAYYVSARWLRGEGLLPPVVPHLFGVDMQWWKQVRATHRRDPLLTVIDDPRSPCACPRCGGPIAFDVARLVRDGWAPGSHGMPWRGECALSAHAVVHASRLGVGTVQSPHEFRAGLEGRLGPAQVWRLADRVPEPADHLH